MKTTYIDPLIPLNESSEEMLTRLSANIGVLTGLMDDAERVGHHSLATMFIRARDAKVEQAEEVIAMVKAGGEESADERRSLLVRGVGSTRIVPDLTRRIPQWPPNRLALTP